MDTPTTQHVHNHSFHTEIAAGLDAQERELMLAAGADTEDAIRFAAEDSGYVFVYMDRWYALFCIASMCRAAPQIDAAERILQRPRTSYSY